MEAKVAAAAVLSITLPALEDGEKYAGLILNEDGSPSHHVVLLDGDTSLTWKKAVEWAKKQGGELPTRREQSLLFANCGAEFKRDWYWSGEQRAEDADYAWGQTSTTATRAGTTSAIGTVRARSAECPFSNSSIHPFQWATNEKS
jgi:hypothetical protein